MSHQSQSAMAAVVKFGLVVGSAFGVADRQVTELFEPVEAAFDDVAVLVDLGIEGRRSGCPAPG
ncbi:hypothetical protein [Amycolatopsis sp. NBC_01286]|uniref:hypothetical protein n=1 Tax=Amycolatopsis sp. NBC_01286 TaxID=2903560 RepID=UPI002E0D6543|nr:hypothetical protein OG570_21135 [Amycolatopsis sp. NBC_01286]